MPYNDKKNFARVLFRNRLKNKLNVYSVRIYKKKFKKIIKLKVKKRKNNLIVHLSF